MSGYTAAGMVAGGAATSAYGQYQTGTANAAAAGYNSAIAGENAKFSEQRAEWAAELGDQEAGISQLKTRAGVAAIKTNQGASGVDINSGSSVAVRDSARVLGMMDAMTIRSNAAREAYGYKMDALNNRAQSELSIQKGKAAGNAGAIGAGSTIISGGGDTYNTYKKSQSLRPDSISKVSWTGEPEKKR